MAGRLTTHVLDTAHGCPAEGVSIELWKIEPGGDTRERLKWTRTNADGRTDVPLLEGAELTTGVYELVFAVGAYFAGFGAAAPAYPFLDRVPVRFGVSDPAAQYHVPLLISPWAYSIYRGS